VICAKIMKIELTASEMAIANVVAAMRTTCNRAAGIVENKKGSHSSYQMEVDGFAAELAFCKAMNLHPDLAVFNQSLTHDCVARNGKTVDVKMTRRPGGRLFVAPNKKASKTQIYALVVGIPPAFTLIGYASAEEVFNVCNLQEIKGSLIYVVEQEKLHAFTNE
jgi:hypothetical protein